ncbi:GLPGLI family protein [Winogradskyella echinorum]|uniref:GLPGLI family protein n=1 Tax=Winogradskyella echinorum TaxID=538189 RepID=A0ABR6Y3V3_9FLAO|nr:GLPGLI family protein [Winogradskyella echinorum]MBC3847435.1 GLPGLI family protein [Winogradskyella echinorum]MBC5751783.1 GLPGLI family protein [Winogradskyella echinorum]
MKKSVSKLALLLFTICFSSIAFAQDFQGKAYYMSKTTIDMDQFGGGQMSAEQKKRMQDRMKSFLEKQYVLTFNKEESIYKEEEKLEAPGGGRGFRGFGSMTGGPQYKNVKSKEALQEQEFFGKQFLIKDELKDLEWKMGTETKQIGQYTVFKATATKAIDESDFTSFRRRGRDNDQKKENDKAKDSTKTGEKADTDSNNTLDELEIPKTIEVVAWYTPQIPINQGPGDYWGLPGLILEVNADRTTILCTKIVMNPEEKEDIDKPKKGDEVTQKEYAEIIAKKMKEMQEMYGGRGRGGRGGGRRN